MTQLEDLDNITGDKVVYDKDWTQGSIVKNLLSLSWPMIVTNTLMMLGPTIDMVWVGRLGSAAIAGVGVAGMAVMLLNSMMMGTGLWVTSVTRTSGGGSWTACFLAFPSQAAARRIVNPKTANNQARDGCRFCDIFCI